MKRELALVLAVALLAGCGGKVVFVEDDGSGANGAGGAGPGPGPGPGQTNSSTGVGIATVCQSYCATWGTCDFGGECTSQCEQLFTGVCDAELAEALNCLSNNFTSCESPVDVCLPVLDQYSQCLEPSPNCFTDFCEESPDGCFCGGICFDELKLEQQCFFLQPGGDGSDGGQPGGDPPPPPGGGVSCDCFLDGGYIGSCDWSEFICSIEEGCCQDLVGEDL